MGTRWRGLLAPINKPTGDGRRIAPGGFTHRPLPLPLKWQKEDSNGHDASVVIGVIDKLNIDEATGRVFGEGEIFDDADPVLTPELAENARTALYHTRKGVIGPSVDPGSATASAVMKGADRAPTMREIERYCADHDGQMPDTEMLFTDYEIAGATLVPIPAFSEARPLELLDSVLASPVPALVAAAGLREPDGSLFLDPKLDRITPMTSRPLADGWTHVFGHVATHDVCHAGLPGMCTTAPYSDQDYQSFHRYHRTAEGVELPLAVGRLTVGHGQMSSTCRCCPGNDDHACNNISFGATVAHHDRMRVLAYGRAGEDEANNAIWFSGVLAPGADERDLQVFSRRKVSGDWREVGGNMELVELLALARREPGFPLPRVSMENGRQRSLTAASPIGAVVERENGVTEFAELGQAFEMLGDKLGNVITEAMADAFGFNKNQKRGPDGKWISMGGPGSATRGRGSDGGGAGAGGDGSGGDAPGARAERDDYNTKILNLGLEANGITPSDEDEDFDEDEPDNELDSMLSDLDDAISGGDTAQADQLADQIADMIRNDWTVRGRVPNPPGMTAASPEGGHSGAMVALRMSEADAARLAVTGGEAPELLHTTLAYLGESAAIPPEVREKIAAKMSAAVQHWGDGIDGDGFAVDVFNPHTAERETAIVMGVGGQALADAHAATMSALGDVDGLEMPEQHAPWVPHVTLQYTDDLNRAKALTDRLGPVKYDRLRLAFGDEVTDIPIGAIIAGDEAGQRERRGELYASEADGEFCADHPFEEDDEDGEMCAKKCGKSSAECATCSDCNGEFADRGQAAALAVRATVALGSIGCCKTPVK